MSFPTHTLYPILDQAWLDQSGFHISAEAVAQQFNTLQLPLIQLRSKGEAGAQWAFMQPWAAAFRRHAPNCRLIINDRVDIALALAADGVHVGQEDLPVAVCRQILGNQAWVGLSTHNAEEIALARQSGCDYIGFGPVHTTDTKQNTYRVQGYARLAEACHLAAHLPVIAIGGIGKDRITPCMQAGAAGVAMISALWRQEDWIERLTDAQHRVHK
ncbi:thiamine-phosphate diphosphorylase [Magnetococcus marinus MC-1]|uniref:Thiamine-phosphate synthase n=1 Tax=Magnetococcus marinus (strain ATCC BAA-1437 / JCM 17883 / MC-1) TaxID=156889 RepID=A0LCT3_MAGMM|nr:thiamine phosphate synthase [Magnetococcus marinus]ABK45776.1 thiamine-phosphate diphosphorylase [Magnetococcus marinus MC-1]